MRLLLLLLVVVPYCLLLVYYYTGGGGLLLESGASAGCSKAGRLYGAVSSIYVVAVCQVFSVLWGEKYTSKAIASSRVKGRN